MTSWGSGGEPLISDSVGWGIVGAMVIVGIYFVYKVKQDTSSDKETLKDKAENLTDASNIVTPRGDLSVMNW